jgi:hypothetical protein
MDSDRQKARPMRIEWPTSTNKGTVLIRLSHQFQPDIVLKDSLKLTPWVRLWFARMPIAGVRFALVIRRRSLALCYVPRPLSDG